MHLSMIDQLSNNGNSFFHKASTIAKIVMTALFLSSIIISRDLLHTLFIILILVAFFTIAKLPLREIGHLCLIPAFFSTLFALFEMQQSFVSGIMIILRGAGSALTMLFLISTTSYIKIFSFLGLFIPGLMLDLLIFTYRSFFILLDRVENLLKSIRLRGGLRSFGIITNIRSLTGIAAVLLLHSFEMGDRMYKIYSLRGYNGYIPVQLDWKPLKVADYALVTFALFVLAGVLFL